MATITELVEAPVDWIDELPDSVSDRAALRRLVDQAEGSDERLMFPGWGMYRIYNRHRSSEGAERDTQRMVVGHGAVGYFPDGPSFGVRVLDELHNFLCMKDPRYEDDRTKIQQNFKIGQAGLVAAVTMVITPYLGAFSAIVAPGVAIVLTLTPRVGLVAWCAAQSERRRRAEQWRAEAQKTALQEQMQRQPQAEPPDDDGAARPHANE